MASSSLVSPTRTTFMKQKLESRKQKCSASGLDEILRIVFSSKKSLPLDSKNPMLGFSNLENHINTALGGISPTVAQSSAAVAHSSKSSPSSSGRKGGYFWEKKQKYVPHQIAPDVTSDGRLGTGNDVSLQGHPLDTVPGDSLAVIGNSNFHSVKASHCVYKGKWMYEVQIGTSGLMQIGWCTSTCKFNRDEGAGDTKHSYAYDGYREAKWTSRCNTKYGEAWEADDIVTCLLDLDNRTTSFLLNGRDLGVAFDDIPTGPGLAYFPVLSLAYKEIAYCNFGLKPMKHPVPGYRPIQDPPADAEEAKYLIGCLESLHRLSRRKPELDRQLDNVSRQVILAHIVQLLGPLMKTPYNVESHLLPFLYSLCDFASSADPYHDLHTILGCLWQYADGREARDCINLVFGCVLRRYRSSPVHVDFHDQTRNLSFMLGLFKHKQTRRNLALHCSFDRHSEIPSLFHIKQVSKHREAGLSKLIPMVWGRDCDPKATYERGYEKLKEKMDTVKKLQREIMQLMVLDGQVPGMVSGAFVKYFRKYLENVVSVHRSEHTVVTPPIVLHSFMQRLVDVVRDLWDKSATTKPGYVKAADGYVPTESFYTDSIDYFDLQRVGGLKSHLLNEHKDELAKEGVSVARGRGGRRPTNEDSPWNEHSAILQLFEDEAAGPSLSTLTRADDDADLDTFNPVLRLARALLNQSNKMTGRDRSITVSRKRSSSEDGDLEKSPTKAHLIELTDGCLLLYSNVMHQHMDKIHTTRTKIVEYATALNEIEIKLKKCTAPNLTDIRDSLTQSHGVLLRHMTELCRAIAWLKASVYDPESQRNLWWLLQLCIRTAHKAAEKGALFTFMPEFYLTAGTRLYKCLREYFAPSQPFEKLPQHDATLRSFIRFLSTFHCDSRVVNNDMKTMLANTITTFITYPLQLKAVETMPMEDLRAFVRNMLYAYDEDKPWTSVGHRILATLWRGSGFAMRYDHPPYVAKVKKLLNREHDPYVPRKLLDCVRELLMTEPTLAGKFVHSILEHLHWSFSEFIGQLQEVHQQNLRGWKGATGLLASLDAQALRQLRIVDMLFELSVSLLRVLELTLAVAPDVFMDWTNNGDSEILSTSLIQCVNQILSRVTNKGSLFDKVVSGKQPGLSSVQHYPLMTSIAGIILKLVKQENKVWADRTVKKLLADASFSMESVGFLLNMQEEEKDDSCVVPRGVTIPYTRSKEKKFVSLQEYEEVMDDEINLLRDAIRFLRREKKNAVTTVEEPMDEDNLCTICYANLVSVVFNPCQHTSCKTCIKQQMMTSKECFYCKAVVESLDEINEQPSITLAAGPSFSGSH
uniref:E3 ubiquitin-protein ligase RNF123 n=1 Tax=Phallusia mammillata TaxID=59560 RepID=A0A6F9DQA7_9ASCI|nr:E3 ubiquitin-protein ligase RNF123 [Phallusia mammillata]